MYCYRLTFLISTLLMALVAFAQDYPTASPKMIIDTEDGEEETQAYSGSAPIAAHFTSNVSNLGSYSARYEWRVYKAGEEENPFLVRYDADFDYTFMESGSSYIKLFITFTHASDTIEYEISEPFSVTASESVLNVPNAFSPNGDGQNDIFRVKDDHRSIIQFKGYIFNRWGKKLFEWDDINSGWDGKAGGHDVADGVYYCRIDAKGADGRVYKIRKAVTLLRSYYEEQNNTEP